MLRHAVLFLALMSVFAPIQGHAQKRKDAAAAVAGGVVGAALAVAAIEELKEMLEYQANNFVLSEFDCERYELKLLDFGGKKLSDQGPQSIVPFSFVAMDSDGKEIERKVVIMHGSPGWLAPTGLQVEMIEYSVWTAARWSNMLYRIASVAGANNLDSLQALAGITSDTDIPIFKRAFPRDCQDSSRVSFLKPPTTEYESAKCYVLHSSINAIAFDLTSSGYSPEGFGAEYLYPFKRLGGDEYLVADFDSKYKLIYNEKTIALFDQNRKRSIQIRRAVIRKITRFLRPTSVPSWVE